MRLFSGLYADFPRIQNGRNVAEKWSPARPLSFVCAGIMLAVEPCSIHGGWLSLGLLYFPVTASPQAYAATSQIREGKEMEKHGVVLGLLCHYVFPV